MKTKKGIFNTLIGVIMTIIISIFQLIFIFVLTKQYPAQFVGLLRVIVSFLSYLSLAEGGLGLITIFSLYRPLQNDDFESVNDIINTTRKNYQSTGKIYFTIIVILGIFVGLLKNFSPAIFVGFNINIAFWQITFIIIALSSKELLFFYFSGAYQNLIQADQKGYLNRLVYIFSEGIMFIILISLFLVPNMPLFFPFISYFICGILKTIFTFIIIKIEYPWLQHKKWIKQKRLLKQSKWIALSRLPELIISNIDIILVTIFLTLSVTTIYTLYLIIATTIRQIALILISSFREVFGYWVAKSGRIKWSTYTKFEMYSYMICGFSFILQFITSEYLISSIYGIQFENNSDTQIKNIFFNLFLSNPIFILFFSLKNTAEIATEPGKVILNATVKHKETLWSSYIQAAIAVSLGITFGLTLTKTGHKDWALYMIMFSVFLSWIYRLISIWIYVWKHLTYNSDLRYILQNSLLLFLPIIFAALLNFLYLFKVLPPVDEINNPKITLNIFGYTFLSAIGTVLAFAMLINFKQFWSIFSIKKLLKKIFINKQQNKIYNEELYDLVKEKNMNNLNINNNLDWTTSYQSNNTFDELIEQEFIRKQNSIKTKQERKKAKSKAIYTLQAKK